MFIFSDDEEHFKESEIMNFIFTTKDGTKFFPIPPNQEPTHLINEDYTKMYTVGSWRNNFKFKDRKNARLDIVSVKEIMR